MKRGDMLILAAVLLFAAVWLGLSRSGGGAKAAVISVGGEEIARIPLSGTAERLIETAAGQNLLLLEPDGVAMGYSTCRSQDCVRAGKITQPGQLIACLPHRVIVVLEGESEGGFDAVTG